MKFSIVTPAYNSEKFIARTIESVLSQEGDFEVEYFIQDGGSSDKTRNIVEEYQKKIPGKISWCSEKDGGMYDAINRGFARATGDIFAHINSDDVYLPGAFQKIADVFRTFPEIDWVTGISAVINENDERVKDGACRLYTRELIQKGVYGRNAYYIAQDAVFWRSSLWKKVGGYDARYRMAGDYDLWIRFSRHAELWSLNAPVSCFRKRSGQLSRDISSYHREQNEIMPQTKFSNFFIRLFFSAQSRMEPHFQKMFLSFYRLLFLEKNAEYLKIENRKIIKKQAFSFIATIK